MPRTPEEIDATVRNLGASVRNILAKKGLTLKTCGTNTPHNHSDLAAFNSQTGHWQNGSGIASKAPRWIVHVKPQGTSVTAEVPALPGSDRLGYYNVRSTDVGGLFVRVLPAIQRHDGTYELYHSWEWIFFLGFRQPLEAGTSSISIDGFDPATGLIRYKGRSQPYSIAFLFSLCEPSDQYVWGPDNQTITFAQATEALCTLLHVSAQSPALPAPPTE